MTTRKILAMIIALVMCVSLSACAGSLSDRSGKKSDSDVQSKFGTFIVVEKGQIKDSNIYQYIMYDPDTMIMYSFLDGYRCGGPIVMYNADGTLKLYSPNAETE